MSYLITASLLNSWRNLEKEYVLEQDFLKVLHRKPIEQTVSMIKGYEFEEWAVNHLPYLQGGQYQVKLSKQYGDYLLYGIVDVLKAGIVYDLKYTSRYDVGKYRGNTQTVMYLTLVPEAHKMIYVASNDEKGNGVIWQEEYSRDEIEPLDALLYNFRNWLEATKLWNVYIDLWRAR